MINALFPGTKRKLRALCFLNTDRDYYFSEVVRATGTRQGVVQRELKTLADSGILSVVTRGRQKFYSANKTNPIFPDLRNIVFKTFGVIGQIRDTLHPLAPKITCAFVYGSFARGEETAASDIDLFIIGSARLEDIVAALSPLENVIVREINPHLLSVAEFKKKLAQKHHFVHSVLASDREFVIGGDSDLGGLADQPVAARSRKQR